MHGSPVARAALVALVDLALVGVFVAIGRSSHGEALGLVGMAQTAGPFVAGWFVGLVVVASGPPTRRNPLGLVAGAEVWVATVVVGMLVRFLVGQGVQTSFVVVTTIVLGVFLLGWRGLVALVRRTRRSRTGTRAPAEVRSAR